MKKLSLIAGLVTAGLSFNAFANTYVGTRLGIMDTTTGSSRFRGIGPGVYIGYGSKIDYEFYFAGELAYHYNFDLTDNSPSQAASLRTTSVLSLSVLPAMMVNTASMVFMKLGLGYAYFSRSSNYRYGYILGLGMETELSPCWSMRAGYDYSSYDEIAAAGTPRSDEFYLGLKYTFDV